MLLKYFHLVIYFICSCRCLCMNDSVHTIIFISRMIKKQHIIFEFNLQQS